MADTFAEHGRPHRKPSKESTVRRKDFNRRDFHRLSAAALSGLVAGAATGCPSSSDTDTGNGAGTDAGGGEGTEVAEKHVCRGLNTCKGRGVFERSSCAGQGYCATVEHHSCHAANACKGLGGCGESVMQNECKGQGECAVPLMDETWKLARSRFEEKMNAQNKQFGDPPPKEETPQGNPDLAEHAGHDHE